MIESAQRKLAMLVQQAEDSPALAVAAKDRAQVLETKVVQLGDAHASEADIERALEQREAALDRQQQRYSHWQQHEQLLARVRSWVSELPRGVVLEAVNVSLTALDGAPKHVIGNLTAEHHAIRTADAPISDAKRQARELVAKLGKKGQPRITTLGGSLTVHGWEPTQCFTRGFSKPSRG